MARRKRHPKTVVKSALTLMKSGIYSRREVGRLLDPENPISEGTIRYWEKLANKGTK